MAGFFGLFNYSKAGPGVSKDEPKKKGFFLFFDILFRKFWKFIRLNLLYTLISLPVLAVYFLLASIPAGMLGSDTEPVTLLMFTFFIAVFFMITLGAGPVTPGFTYVVRNFAREEHAWIASDFFEHIKKNFKQSIVVFLIDLVVVYLMMFNLNFYFVSGAGGVLPAVMQTMTIIFIFIYMMARMYLYPIMVTFDLKLKDIYKNSFLLCFYKLPQNLLIFVISVGILVAIAWYIPMLLLIVVPVILFSVVGLIQMMYVYSVIDKVMIPKSDDNDDNEATFTDRI